MRSMVSRRDAMSMTTRRSGVDSGGVGGGLGGGLGAALVEGGGGGEGATQSFAVMSPWDGHQWSVP